MKPPKDKTPYEIRKKYLSRSEVDKILLSSLHREKIESCQIRNPMQCRFSLFFADDKSKAKWHGCCPQYWEVNKPRWIQNKEDGKLYRVDTVLKGKDSLRLSKKWQNQTCPYQK